MTASHNEQVYVDSSEVLLNYKRNIEMGGNLRKKYDFSQSNKIKYNEI